MWTGRWAVGGRITSLLAGRALALELGLASRRCTRGQEGRQRVVGIGVVRVRRYSCVGGEAGVDKLVGSRSAVISRNVGPIWAAGSRMMGSGRCVSLDEDWLQSLKHGTWSLEVGRR